MSVQLNIVLFGVLDEKCYYVPSKDDVFVALNIASDQNHALNIYLVDPSLEPDLLSQNTKELLESFKVYIDGKAITNVSAQAYNIRDFITYQSNVLNEKVIFVDYTNNNTIYETMFHLDVGPSDNYVFITTKRENVLSISDVAEDYFAYIKKENSRKMVINRKTYDLYSGNYMQYTDSTDGNTSEIPDREKKVIITIYHSLIRFVMVYIHCGFYDIKHVNKDITQYSWALQVEDKHLKGLFLRYPPEKKVQLQTAMITNAYFRRNVLDALINVCANFMNNNFDVSSMSSVVKKEGWYSLKLWKSYRSILDEYVMPASN